MTITEKDIIHENGKFWVLNNRDRKRPTYDVMNNTGTHSITFQSFPHDDDGLSNAIAHCNYKAERASK